jgi:hypothetical protein
LWAAWDDTDVGHVFLNNWGDTSYYGIWMQINPDGQFGVHVGNGNIAAGSSRRGRNSTGSVLIRGQWHHLAAVVRGLNDMELYLDGVNVSGDYNGTASSMVYNDGPAYMARFTVTNDVFYRGGLDDIRFYNRAFSESEIAILANE